MRRLILVLLLSACGAAPESQTGRLLGGGGPLPGAIAGMRYRAGAHAGFTDADGRFRYDEGDRIVFGVGGLEFEPTPARALVSPYQLANGRGCAAGAALTRTVQVIQSLDVNGAPDDGVTLPELPAAGPVRRVVELADAELEAAVHELAPGATIVAPDAALGRFIRLVSDESWEDDRSDTFELIESVHRSQGIATDGESWFFSAKNHLERTTFDFEVTAENVQPIPAALFKQGANHIGDIDVHDGRLFAPIEDGPDYLYPTIVTFDAATLEPTGASYPLPTDKLTKGVPWVAVDGPRRRVYAAEWEPTDRLFRFDLDRDLAFVDALPLSPPIARVQGAKVFGGALYASSDDEQKTIYKIDLDTGIVMPLRTLGTVGSEAEGLALLDARGGARLCVLDVIIPAVTAFQWRRVREPLRDALCR